MNPQWIRLLNQTYKILKPVLGPALGKIPWGAAATQIPRVGLAAQGAAAQGMRILTLPVAVVIGFGLTQLQKQYEFGGKEVDTKETVPTWKKREERQRQSREDSV